MTAGFKVITAWLQSNSLKPFAFQQETWQHIINGRSGLLNAPTGCGKTYAVFLASLIHFVNQHPKDYQFKKNNGLQLLWVCPLRSLAKDIGRAMEEVIEELNMQWKVAIRNGDTNASEKAKQKKQMPEILIITPESLHILLTQKGYPQIFNSLKIIAVDEWHDLLGSKRAVLVELALARIINCVLENGDNSPLIWGISATIGNLVEAKEVLLSPLLQEGVIVTANLHKKIEITSIFPDEVENYSWSGHLGIKLAHKILPIIDKSKTTLLFINTRGMSETWYQTLLNIAPELAGTIALHHGSVDKELRTWVEENLHLGKLKLVVCTASLDLGVDFRPVETVIQVGSPKGVARFLQRAGRSGHSPDAVSKIYFLPTHSLELIEAAALKSAIAAQEVESRVPLLLCFDVLLQFCCTLALSEGFTANELFKEIKSTYCFKEITSDEFQKIIHHLTNGGNALQQYDEFKKIELINDRYFITNSKIAMRHRLHIGTIVSDAMLKVKFLSGGYVGVIEEYFISGLEPGEVFALSGYYLELIAIKDMTVLVRKSNSKKAKVPSWGGGRMPLSANLGEKLRQAFHSAIQFLQSKSNDASILPELSAIGGLLQVQQQLSHIPDSNELLIEHIETKDGFHLFVYPFEGRLVHEAMAALLAYRISKIKPMTFSFAMNDYGFELLSDQPIPLNEKNAAELFSITDLLTDIQRSVNASEMAKRKFRDIAVIGGLIFQGYPGEHKKSTHLQSSASLIFKVLQEYEPDNLLLRLAYQEVLDQQMEEVRLRKTLQRVEQSKIVIQYPKQLTPFCFPIKVDSMREDLSSEKLEDRVRKMQQSLAKQ